MPFEPNKRQVFKKVVENRYLRSLQTSLENFQAHVLRFVNRVVIAPLPMSTLESLMVPPASNQL